MNVDTFVIELLFGLLRGQGKLMLRGLRSLVSITEWRTITWIDLHHASFGDFLHDRDRSKEFHVDPGECMYTGFCDAFSLGCNMLGICVPDGGIESTVQHPKGLSVTTTVVHDTRKQSTYLLVGVTEAEFKNIQRLSDFLYECSFLSSRKDELVEVVRESIATGIWYPCLHGLDNWSDWDRFAALELLVATVDPYGVPDFPFLVPNFMQLRHWFHRSISQLRQPRILPRS